MRPIPYHIARAFDAPKMHLSLSNSRRLAVEMPIGDPTGGAAYGEHAMPVVVVAMAASSFAAGAAAVTAIGATMTSMVIGGAMMVGSALTIVGTITGNEKLAKIGGIISLVGGVAGLATGALGAVSGAGSEVGGLEAADAAAGAGAESALGAGADAAAGSSMPSFPGGDSVATINAGSANAPGGGLLSTAGDQAAAAGGQAAQGAGAAVDAAAAPMSTQAQNAMQVDALSTNSAFQTPNYANDLSGTGGQMPFNSGSKATSTVGGYFDKASKFVKDNKDMLDYGGKIVKGLISQDGTDLSRAQADLSRAQADRTRVATEDDKRRAAWRRGMINY